VGRACSTQGDQEMHIKFGLKYFKGRDHIEDVDTDGKLLLKWFSKK